MYYVWCNSYSQPNISIRSTENNEAGPNKKNNDGMTAFHFAMYKCQKKGAPSEIMNV